MEKNDKIVVIATAAIATTSLALSATLHIKEWKKNRNAAKANSKLVTFDSATTSN